MNKLEDGKETQNKPELYTVLGVVRVRMDEFMIHLDTRQHTIQFEVYPVQDWTHLPTGKEGTSYIDKENEPDSREEFEEGKCLKNLKARFVGVAYGKVDFTLLMMNIGVKILKSYRDCIMIKFCLGAKTLLKIENLIILTMISITLNVVVYEKCDN